MPGPLGVGAVLASGLVGAKLAYLGDLAGAGAKLVKAKLVLGKGALRARLVGTRGCWTLRYIILTNVASYRKI